ncbi:hypothetical protein [Acuticoccus sediminis]|nr:hypothetical protein [Acuticoccus sediminis]
MDEESDRPSRNVRRISAAWGMTLGAVGIVVVLVLAIIGWITG